MSECKAWVAEMKRRMGYVDEPDESLMKQRKKLKSAAAADEPKTVKEAVEALDFADTDPKDKGNRKVRYEEPLSTENRQQDMFLLLAEAMAAMASDKKKAEFYQKRLERGMEWDKKEKRWKWKDEDEPGRSNLMTGWIRLPELERIFGVCKRTVRRKAENGELPPLRRIGRAVGMLESQVKAYFQRLSQPS